MKEKKTVRISVAITESMMKEIQRYCEDYDTNISDFFRRAAKKVLNEVK